MVVVAPDEFEPVAERVGGEEAPHAGDGVVPERRVAGSRSRAASASMSATTISGCALRAGRNSASTPRWISTAPLLTQMPPRFASSGGFTSSVMPSTPT